MPSVGPILAYTLYNDMKTIKFWNIDASDNSLVGSDIVSPFFDIGSILISNLVNRRFYALIGNRLVLVSVPANIPVD